MRILVTGSSGFLGTAVTGHLRSLGHAVAGFSRRAESTEFPGDVRDPAAIGAAMKRFAPDAVVHLASQTDLGAEISSDYSTNVGGVQTLANTVASAPSVKRVIWASSQLVYRTGSVPPSDTAYDPVGAYGASKAEGERIVRATDGGSKIWTIVRPTTVWGPGMSPHYQRLLRLIDKGLYFHVGHKPRLKSYSYIDNLVAQFASLLAADTDNVHRRTIYLADPQPIDIRAWCDGFAKHFGRSIPTLPEPAADLIGRVGDLIEKTGRRFPLTTQRLQNIRTEYVFDTGPIEKIAGDSPVSMEVGIQRTAAWFRSLG